VRAPSFWMSRGFHNELTANPCNVENAFEKLLEVNFIPAALNKISIAQVKKGEMYL